MNATCERCTCGGLGTCPACRRIVAVVAAESASPATAAEFMATSRDSHNLRDAARRALDGLTALQRQVLFLRLVDGLPAWRVARRLGLPGRVIPGLVDAAEVKLADPGPGVAA